MELNSQIGAYSLCPYRAVLLSSLFICMALSSWYRCGGMTRFLDSKTFWKASLEYLTMSIINKISFIKKHFKKHVFSETFSNKICNL